MSQIPDNYSYQTLPTEISVGANPTPRQSEYHRATVRARPEEKVEKKDLDIALQAARRAAILIHYRDPGMMDELARVYLRPYTPDGPIPLPACAVCPNRPVLRDVVR
jgi:hypothetical protein